MAGDVRPIRIIGDPVLRERCTPVTEFDDALASLIDDMFASMYAVNGVGLAANQIGVPLRVFVYDCQDGDGPNRVGHLVNPVLEELPAADRKLTESDEGCLSIPGQWTSLARTSRAVARGFDRTGKRVTVPGSGQLARCLQHEADHLDGMLFIDRLTQRSRRKLMKAFENDRPR